MKPINICGVPALLLAVSLALTSTAQTVTTHKRQGALYVAWGYNQEWYTRSDVHISQPGQNSDYTLNNVKGRDHMGWNNKSIFKQPISIPQYNWRIGYFFNKKQDLGIEINFDHTKYIIGDQDINLSGTRNGAPTSETIRFSEKNGFIYYLNNGANFLLFNIVKRWGIYHTNDRAFSLDALGKAGIGPVYPHVENTFFGESNNPHFQFGGWNAGVETSVRATFFRYGFAEFAQKVDYARYSNLKIANGTVRQSFGTYELILTVGFILPTHSGNPLFTRPKHATIPAQEDLNVTDTLNE